MGIYQFKKTIAATLIRFFNQALIDVAHNLDIEVIRIRRPHYL
jgi:hypothetical protein